MTRAHSASELGVLAGGLLDQIIGGPKSVALIDYPNSENVGDNAILLGELAWLRTRGHTLDYACSENEYSRSALVTLLPPEGVILLHGGGNFGDLYPHHQRLRERVVRDFPAQRVVQLPQTVNFRSEASAAASARKLAQHENLTLLVRDRASVERLKSAFTNPVVLCPDMAFCLPPLSRTATPTFPVQRLLRRDKEANSLGSIGGVDWLRTEDNAWSVRIRRRLNNQLVAAARFSDRAAVRLVPHLARQFEILAQARLEFGLRLLSRGEVVVTDRLHGHIVATLAGIPNIVLNDRHGKVRDFVATWTGHIDGVHVAADREAAERLAVDLIKTS